MHATHKMVDLFNGRWMFKAYGSFAHTNENEYKYILLYAYKFVLSLLLCSQKIKILRISNPESSTTKMQSTSFKPISLNFGSHVCKIESSIVILYFISLLYGK